MNAVGLGNFLEEIDVLWPVLVVFFMGIVFGVLGLVLELRARRRSELAPWRPAMKRSRGEEFKAWVARILFMAAICATGIQW